MLKPMDRWMSSPNADAHDREIKKGTEGKLAEAFT